MIGLLIGYQGNFVNFSKRFEVFSDGLLSHFHRDPAHKYLLGSVLHCLMLRVRYSLLCVHCLPVQGVGAGVQRSLHAFLRLKHHKCETPGFICILIHLQRGFIYWPILLEMLLQLGLSGFPR